MSDDLLAMSMNSEEMIGAVVRCLRAGKAAMIHGAPGTGKTEIVRDSIGPIMRLPVWEFLANSKEPVDLRGLPIMDTARGVTSWLPPEDLPTEPALIFIDELTTVGQSMQAPLYSIVHERRLGKWRAHPDTRIVAAGNREKDRAIAFKMSTALSTRMGHFDLIVNPDQWCLWAARSGRISPEMIGFIRFQPQLLDGFRPELRTSPTPRTVEAADKIWRQEPPERTALREIAAHVGEGFAVEFLAFVNVWHRMPDIDAIIKKPSGFEVPRGKDAMSMRFAIAAAVSFKMTPDNMANCCVVLDALGEEFSVFAIKDAYARDKDIGKCRTFQEWGMKHHDLLG